MPQFVANSGVRLVQPLKPPARMTAAPPEPPFMEMPAGCKIEVTLAAGHAVALPGMPLPVELATFHAPDPTGGKLAPAVQPAAMIAVCAAKAPRFWPAIATLDNGESSPNTGARNDVPQVPRIVRSSIGAQLKAIFGLL